MNANDSIHRIAVIGCGDIARSGHIPAIVSHPHFELVALCDRDMQVLELLKNEYGINDVVTDYRILLERSDIDGCVLALHPEHSVDIAIELIEAGKAVLDEKPVAVNLDAAYRLKDTLDKHGGIYQIGFVLRSCEWVRGVSEYAKRVGRPTLTQVNVFDEKLDKSDLNHFNKIQGILRQSSAVTHEGSHIVDYTSLWQPGAVQNVDAQAIKTDRDFFGPNIWNVLLRKQDGDLLSFTVGWLLADLPSSGVQVTGPNGWFEVDMFTGQGKGMFSGAEEKISLPPLAQAWDKQLDQFHEAIVSNCVAGPTVEDGIRALKITSACEQSY